MGTGVCAGAVLAGTMALAQQAAPVYASGAPVVKIPYSRQVDFDHIRNTLLYVKLSINGGEAHSFNLDTGSVGILLPAEEIPNFDGKGEPASITYLSSGVHLEGVRTTVAVTFPDSQGPDGKPVVAHVPVIAVTKHSCTGKGVNSAHCSEDGPVRTHMMGVGFGRGEGSADAQKKNPFVMLDAMENGSMRRGYMLTRDGVQLGLNAESVGKDFVYQKLEVRPETAAADFKGPRDYVTAPGTFSVNDKRVMMGTILMDTGLTNMMLAVPGGPQEGGVPNGTKIGIDLLSGKLHYEFTVGDPDGKAVPRKVDWVRAAHGVYVNTGLRALSLFDYLYDAEGGYLALRPRSK